MSDISTEWREADRRQRGIELSIEESAHLWNWLQRDDVAPYWEDPIIARIANKAKSFHKYGPWDSSDVQYAAEDVQYAADPEEWAEYEQIAQRLAESEDEISRLRAVIEGRA